ncbi:FG-GAP repeat protein [Engelhardtia mirabilis]|uniref:FG-GAP repeat protein n=1 Tax=Engelhardtia mirabilis TaxID=2528011 RepID=A0A518BDL4_9BACT|nr:hypothetical protein Pla133_01050 [Planctomycetes bacterium Pla133]QDU99368.1 hypothetical protein Pla86_01050 [Planctomycetes bacterium Pla86]
MHLHSLTACVLLASPALSQQSLAPPNLETGVLGGFQGAMFGATVVVDGDRALIAAPVTNLGTSFSGAAWIYHWNGQGWELEQRLDAPGVESYQEFGTHADLRGDVAVVGCRYMDTASGFNSGGAVVFERQAGAWNVVAELTPPAGSAGKQFGRGIAVDGDLVVVNTDQPQDPFLVYERQANGTWPLVGEVNLDQPQGLSLLQSSAEVRGDTLYLPMPYQATSEGEIQVFERDALGWHLAQKIRTNATTPFNYLGRSFDVDGDTLVSGSPFVEQPGGVQGQVTVFERIGGQWFELDELSDGPANMQSLYGDSVALSGDRMLVGQPQSGLGVAGTPRLHVYERLNGAWTLVRTELDPRGTPVPYVPGQGVYGTYFGDALDLDGERAIVGAPFDDALFQDAGEAWVYDVGRLGVDVGAVSLGAGGTQALDLQAGFPEAGNVHLVLGSFAGSSPGLAVAGTTLPLNADPYLLFLLANPNAPPVVGGLGLLDANGQGSAQVVVGAASAPALAGLTVAHAYVVLDAVSFVPRAASEAEALELLP